MKDETIIFFDNTDDYSKYDEAKQAVYESFYDSQDWTSIDDVPNDMVWEEIAAQNEADWKYFTGAFKRLLEKHTFLVTGTCGRWNGPCEGGNFITGWDDFCLRLRRAGLLAVPGLRPPLLRGRALPVPV